MDNSNGFGVAPPHLRAKRRSGIFSDLLKVRIALDIAKAMRYLHSHRPPVVHRDLKSPNIVLASFDPLSPTVCKVIDFGSSQMLTGTTTGRVVTNPVWLAPEIMENRPYSGKVDVYSYGVILYEVFAELEYYGNLSYMFQVEEMVLRGERPKIPSRVAPEYANIIKMCWSQEAFDRPSFIQIVEMWRDVIDILPELESIRGDISRAPDEFDELLKMEKELELRDREIETGMLKEAGGTVRGTRTSRLSTCEDINDTTRRSAKESARAVMRENSITSKELYIAPFLENVGFTSARPQGFTDFQEIFSPSDKNKDDVNLEHAQRMEKYMALELLHGAERTDASIIAEIQTEFPNTKGFLGFLEEHEVEAGSPSPQSTPLSKRRSAHSKSSSRSTSKRNSLGNVHAIDRRSSDYSMSQGSPPNPSALPVALLRVSGDASEKEAGSRVGSPAGEASAMKPDCSSIRTSPTSPQNVSASRPRSTSRKLKYMFTTRSTSEGFAKGRSYGKRVRVSTPDPQMHYSAESHKMEVSFSSEKDQNSGLFTSTSTQSDLRANGNESRSSKILRSPFNIIHKATNSRSNSPSLPPSVMSLLEKGKGSEDKSTASPLKTMSKREQRTVHKPFLGTWSIQNEPDPLTTNALNEELSGPDGRNVYPRVTIDNKKVTATVLCMSTLERNHRCEVWAGLSSGQIVVFDGYARTTVGKIDAHTGPVLAMTSMGRKVVWSCDERMMVKAWHPLSWKLRREVSLASLRPSAPISCLLSAGDILFIGAGAEIYMMDYSRGVHDKQKKSPLQVIYGNVRTFILHSHALWVGTSAGLVRANTNNLTVTSSESIDGGVHDMLAVGADVWTCNGNGSLSVWDGETGMNLRALSLNFGPSPRRLLLVQSMVWCQRQDGSVSLWDAKCHKQLLDIGHPTAGDSATACGMATIAQDVWVATTRRISVWSEEDVYESVKQIEKTKPIIDNVR